MVKEIRQNTVYNIVYYIMKVVTRKNALQTVKIQMRWLIMSPLIRIYTVYLSFFATKMLANLGLLIFVPIFVYVTALFEIMGSSKVKGRGSISESQQ